MSTYGPVEAESQTDPGHLLHATVDQSSILTIDVRTWVDGASSFPDEFSSAEEYADAVMLQVFEALSSVPSLVVTGRKAMNSFRPMVLTEPEG